MIIGHVKTSNDEHFTWVVYNYTTNILTIGDTWKSERAALSDMLQLFSGVRVLSSAEWKPHQSEYVGKKPRLRFHGIPDLINTGS